MLKKGIDERIEARIKKLKSGKAKRYFHLNIGFPSKQQALDKNQIDKSVKRVEDFLPELVRLIKEVRPHFKNIWDQNRIVASYLLLSKSYRSLEGVVNEAKRGNPTSVVELARSGCEAVDLVFLFLSKDGGAYLKRWFKGEIIGNKESRRVFEKEVKEMFSKKGAPDIKAREMKGDVYWIYSLYTHSAYGAILDMVDVFYEDFDFKRYAGYHYTRQYLHLVENLIVNILLGLKNIFLIIGDSDNLAIVERSLGEFHSQFASPREITDFVVPGSKETSKRQR